MSWWGFMIWSFVNILIYDLLLCVKLIHNDILFLQGKLGDSAQVIFNIIDTMSTSLVLFVMIEFY